MYSTLILGTEVSIMFLLICLPSSPAYASGVAHSIPKAVQAYITAYKCRTCRVLLCSSRHLTVVYQAVFGRVLAVGLGDPQKTGKVGLSVFVSINFQKSDLGLKFWFSIIFMYLYIILYYYMLYYHIIYLYIILIFQYLSEILYSST